MDAQKKLTDLKRILVPLLLLSMPLAIGLAWGIVTDDGAYVTFRCAHNLAAVRGLVYDSPLGTAKSPLYALALWLPAALGLPLPQTGLVMSALGWGTAVLAIYNLCQALHKPTAAIASAVLAALGSAFIPTLGTDIPWVVALAWIAFALSASEHWRLQTSALVLMLCLRFEISTLVIAALLLFIRWIKRRRFPLKSSVAIVLIAITWAGSAMLELVPPLSPLTLNLSMWSNTIERLFGESDLYWLFLPAIGVGLFSLLKSPRILGAGLPGVALIALSSDALAGTLIATLGLLLAGLGIDAISRNPLDQIRAHDAHTPLYRLALSIGVVAVIVSPLTIAQATSLLQRYRARPTIRQALEQQAGDWLRATSAPTASLLSSARVGFLASRPTLPWNGDKRDTAAFAALVETLVKSPPDYCVSYRDLYWGRLTRTGWFQDDYTAVLMFSSPYDTVASLTIWRYAHAEKPQPVEATFGDQIHLVSFAATDSLTSGQTLDVRLYWEALQPLEEDYIVFVHLLDSNGELAASHDGPPRDGKSPTSTWLPGDVIPDVHSVDLGDNTPAGTYQLWVGIYTWPDIERLGVRDRNGVEQINQTLFLQTVKVYTK